MNTARMNAERMNTTSIALWAMLWVIVVAGLTGCATAPDYADYSPAVPPSEVRVYSSPAPIYYHPPVRDHRIDSRQYSQQKKIAAGIRTGELTSQEARALKAEQRDIQAEERAYKRDGYLSSRERAELNRELNIAERNIYNQARDRQESDRR